MPYAIRKKSSKYRHPGRDRFSDFDQFLTYSIFDSPYITHLNGKTCSLDCSRSNETLLSSNDQVIREKMSKYWEYILFHNVTYSGNWFRCEIASRNSFRFRNSGNWWNWFRNKMNSGLTQFQNFGNWFLGRNRMTAPTKLNSLIFWIWLWLD